MKYLTFAMLAIALSISACTNSAKNEDQSHSHEADDPDHSHESAHLHEDFKLLITEYSEQFELFAEADPLIIGQEAEILAHFTSLSDFKPLINAQIELNLNIGGFNTSQIIEESIRPGIYKFHIKPELKGKGILLFSIKQEDEVHEIEVKGLRVYASIDEAYHEEFTETDVHNAVAFTKEQSWKVDFETLLPKYQAFGKTIKAVGQVEIPKCEEQILSARNNGILTYTHRHLIKGKKVFYGQKLFSLSSENFVDNNLSIRLSEASNDFNTAKANLERSKALLEEKLILESEFLEVDRTFENAKLQLENLNKNYTKNGKWVVSPLSGSVKELFVNNGEYVEAGTPIASIINNEKVLITADIELKHAALLPSIDAVSIKKAYDNKLVEYKGNEIEELTIGKHTNADNYMVPVSIELDNVEHYIPGSFVELFIKTIANKKALIIPNSALVEEQGSYYVFVQKTPEEFEKAYVSVGETDGNYTEIREGITQNDRIVSKGAIFIKLAQASGTLDAHSGHVH